MLNINYLKIYTITMVIVGMQLSNCAYAILDKKAPKPEKKTPINTIINKKEITNINFDEICNKAKEHSYDLKMTDFDILIAKQGVRGARAEYFPKLMLSANTEYTKNFRDNRDTTVMSIGESFINPYTRYQSVMGISVNYNLFDFGVRGGNLNIAKEDIILQDLKRKEQLQELNLNLVDIYSKILMTQKQIKINKEILALEKKNLEYKERLYNAGELIQTELNDEIVKVQTIEKRISELLGIYTESVNWLSFYTGDEYRINDLHAENLERVEVDKAEGEKDYTKSITWQIKEAELKKKEYEIKVAQRTNYPKLSLYGRYYLYGSDPLSYKDSLKDIRSSNFTVGGSISMLAFDGMKNRANIQKTKLEYKKLQVERDKAIAQLLMRIATMRNNLLYLDEQISNNTKIVKELSAKQKSVHRLVSKQLATPIEENDIKISLLEQQIEYDKNTITSAAITKGIQILTTY